MKYYTIEVAELLDGTNAQTINLHVDDENSSAYDKAMAKFHEFMHYQMIVGTVKKALCLVMSEQGVVSHTESWEKSIPVETEVANEDSGQI